MLVEAECDICWISLIRPEKLNNITHEMVREALDRTEAFCGLFATEDFGESVAIFLEKRKPSFWGK